MGQDPNACCVEGNNPGNPEAFLRKAYVTKSKNSEKVRYIYTKLFVC